MCVQTESEADLYFMLFAGLLQSVYLPLPASVLIIQTVDMSVVSCMLVCVCVLIILVFHKTSSSYSYTSCR